MFSMMSVNSRTNYLFTASHLYSAVIEASVLLNSFLYIFENEGIGSGADCAGCYEMSLMC